MKTDTMHIRLVGFAVCSLFVLMMVPAYASVTVTSMSLEKNFYTTTENFSFIGTINGTETVFVIIRDAQGNFKGMLSDPIASDEFDVIPRPVSNFFSSTGIYNATGFTDKEKEENGFVVKIEYDGNKIFAVPDKILQLNTITDKIIEVEKTVTFTASITDSSIEGEVFSLANNSTGATIDPSSGKFVWTPSKSYGNIQDVQHYFDIIVKHGAQEDKENFKITVRQAFVEPEITPEPKEITPEPKEITPEPKEMGIAQFVDPNLDPQHYIDRYNNEVTYKDWFDNAYPEYDSIYQAVGVEEPKTPIEVKEEFGECGEGTDLVDGMCVIDNSEGGGCLIATAAYGSEMAPQVQLLREIRDNQLMNTDSGISFMTGFNQLYYSFSPHIADMQRENPAFKEIIKLGITPLLSSLSIMEHAESDSEVIGYGIGVILLNIGMYFAAPAMVIIKTRKYIRI